MHSQKGFTLLEITLTSALILIMGTFSILGISNYKKISNDFKVASLQSSLLSFINSGKLFCRDNRKSGVIIFDIVNNNAKFYCDGKKIESLIPDKGINLVNINAKENKIRINDKGITSDACTISFRDMEGVLHKITIAVGTAYVEIKE